MLYLTMYFVVFYPIMASLYIPVSRKLLDETALGATSEDVRQKG